MKATSSPITTASSKRSRLLLILVTFVLGVIYITPSEKISQLFRSKMTADATGWHSRSPAETAPSEFKDVVFGLLYSTPVEPEGFTMALFKDQTAVDAMGKVQKLSQADYDAFLDVVGSVPDEKDQLRVKQDRTSFPIDTIVIPSEGKSVGVYGWSKDKQELENGGSLPDSVQKLIAYGREARTGYVRGEKDEALIQKVLDLLN